MRIQYKEIVLRESARRRLMKESNLDKLYGVLFTSGGGGGGSSAGVRAGRGK